LPERSSCVALIEIVGCAFATVASAHPFQTSNGVARDERLTGKETVMTSIPPPADQRDQRDHALTRRALLVVGAGAGSAAAVGRLAQGISPAANAAGSGAPTAADLQELDASISGSVVLPTA
jgi:hypothetical protein